MNLLLLPQINEKKSNMKKLTFFVLAIGMMIPMMFSMKTATAQSATEDTLKASVSTIKDKIAGVEERIATAEADLAKLTKIKISGYVQAQWQHFENVSSYPGNYFTIRRARFKLQYEPANGVAFVLQPDFQPGNFVVKEAYAKLNDRWLKTFSIWAGKFNRPNYEIEYSSSDLEVLERSRVITSLYPGEYAIGVKLEATPQKFPLKVQLALFNGNDNWTIADATGANINPDNKDFDNAKDFMARVTYAFKLGRWGGLTIGAHGYFGAIKATTDTLIKSDFTKDKSVAVGSTISKRWFGVEAQFYADILGGLTIKGEYITGMNSTPGYSNSTTVASPVSSAFNKGGDTLTVTNLTTITKNYRPNITRNFSGYYVYLVKNIGKRNQFAIRYDVYDPNSSLGASDIGVKSYGVNTSSSKTNSVTTNAGSKTVIDKYTTTTTTNYAFKSGTADLKYATLGLAWSYFFDDNIKLSIEYDIPMNEKVGVNSKGVGNVTSTGSVNNQPYTIDYSTLFPQNTLTLRIQAKF